MKKFKIAVCLVLAVCITGLFSVAAVAKPKAKVKAMDTTGVTSSGKALINDWFIGGDNYSYFDIHNITDQPINVSMVLYNPDGSLLKDDGNVNSGIVQIPSYYGINYQNYSENDANDTVSFALGAHCSTDIRLGTSSTARLGYGEIKWSQSGTTYKGLIVNAEFGSSSVRVPINVNSGMEF